MVLDKSLLAKYIIFVNNMKKALNNKARIKRDRSDAIKSYQVFIHRSSYRGCSIKKVFSKISQNSQESTCARVSF